MQEALALARGELGEDAVVLNTKHVKAGGLMGLRGGTKVELMAAVDDSAQVVEERTVQPYSPPQIARNAEAVGASVGMKPAERVSRMDVRDDQQAAPPTAPMPDPEVSRLREELKELGAIVRGLTVARPVEQGVEAPLMIELGVDEDLARGPLADLLSTDDPIALAAGLAGKLQAFTAPPIAAGRQVIAFVGPTGVGKTTTLAKLAAVFALEQRVKVAMVTADTFRIGAVEQLRTYARIMGIPLEVALSPDEVTAAVEKHADKDVVLVDTVGRSQRSEEHLAELKAFVDAAKPTDTHLVVAASLSKRAQDEVVERFAALSPTKLVITKIDETPELGCLVNLPLRTGLAVSCLTNGQNVPQDLDPADAGYMARLFVGVDL